MYVGPIPEFPIGNGTRLQKGNWERHNSKPREWKQNLGGNLWKFREIRASFFFVTPSWMKTRVKEVRKEKKREKNEKEEKETKEKEKSHTKMEFRKFIFRRF